MGALKRFITIKCPNCGSAVSENINQCDYCGSKLIFDNDTNSISINGVVCNKCGVSNNNEAIFCNNCGEGIRTKCRNCRKLIVNRDINCPYCGVVHHSEVLTKQENAPEKDYQIAVSFREGKRFPDAEIIFCKTEKNYLEKPEFYVDWIKNYLFWGMSFDSNISLHNFSTLYRNKALEMYGILSSKFPSNPSNKDVFALLIKNKTIKYEDKKEGCFIATTIYGDPNCREVAMLREWRDKHLKNRFLGEIAIRQYRIYGSYLARTVGKNRFLKLLFLKIFNYIISSN